MHTRSDNKMTLVAKSNAQRLTDFRNRNKAAGLKELRNLWAHPDDHESIKKFAESLAQLRHFSG